MWLAAVSPDLSFTDYGILGTALASSTSAVVYLARAQIKRETDRADRKDIEAIEANRQMLSILTERVIPALAESTQAVKGSTELQQKVHDLLQRLLEVQRRDQ